MLRVWISKVFSLLMKGPNNNRLSPLSEVIMRKFAFSGILESPYIYIWASIHMYQNVTNR